MVTYLFTHPSLKGKILFKYDFGRIKGFEIDGEPTEGQLHFIMDRFPINELDLQFFHHDSKGTLKKIETDLSFDTFWNSYNYKVGNKKRAEKLYEALSDADKAEALRVIPIYDQFLAIKKNQDKLYAETYLSQRRFENNYKIL